MENDLISRGAVLKLIEDIRCNPEVPKNYGTLLDIIRGIREIPVAYDVDKVVEQLEEKRENHRKDAHAQMYKHKNDDWAQYLDGMQCGIRDSIETVKSGGID